MTLQQVRDIDSLIDWLDNERDGAEDAGSVARSATNWHPALVALRLELANLVRQYSDLKQFGSCEAETALAAARIAREQDTLAFQHALAEKDAEIAAMAKGTSHDCDIIADGADTEEQLRADLMGQRDAYDILLDHANELERANAALRADIANWPVCDQHKPGLWDGDPPCVICEAHREHAVLAEVRGLLTEIWHSIPSSYDEADPMVQRHARALNALQAWAAKETP